MASRKSERRPKALDEGGVITAIGKAFSAVEDPAARNRILQWALAAYGTGQIRGKGTGTDNGPGKTDPGDSVTPSADLGVLIEQTDPQSPEDRVLVVCYWLQENESLDGFAAKPVNDKLKDMGHRVSNITDKLGQLIAKKPALIRQVSKSGKNRQARKKYKLTDAGRKRVQALLRGEGSTEEKE